MGFFTLAKRCPYCAHKLDRNKKCVNKECIAYGKTTEEKTEETKDNK